MIPTLGSDKWCFAFYQKEYKNALSHFSCSHSHFWCILVINFMIHHNKHLQYDTNRMWCKCNQISSNAASSKTVLNYYNNPVIIYIYMYIYNLTCWKYSMISPISNMMVFGNITVLTVYIDIRLQWFLQITDITLNKYCKSFELKQVDANKKFAYFKRLVSRFNVKSNL